MNTSEIHAQKLEWLELPDHGRVSPAEADKIAADEGDGWRLPTVAEQLSCIDRTRYSPAVDAEKFPGVKPEAYWTSETCAWDGSARWVVDFLNGLVLNYYFFNRARVRLCRRADIGKGGLTRSW